MSNIVQITQQQVLQFNMMLATLAKISKDYQTTDEIRDTCEDKYGLDYEETLEMAYDNIKLDAEHAIQGVQYIKIPNP